MTPQYYNMAAAVYGRNALSIKIDVLIWWKVCPIQPNFPSGDKFQFTQGF